MESQMSSKKIVFWAGISVFMMFVLVWLWNYYHTGTIIITTDNPNNTITLSRIDGSEISKANKKLSATVSTGEYKVYVKGNSVATVQNILLKPRKTQRYNINPVNATGVEPVAYVNAQDVGATTGQLVYLDGIFGALFKIDGQNNIKKINASHKFEEVRWADPSFGVAQDSKGHLYYVVSGEVKAMSVPFDYDGLAISFDVSPDRNVYITHGAEVYVGKQEGSFKKIYTSSSEKPSLASANGHLAVSDSMYGRNASPISEPLLATVDASGKIQKINEESERLAWSPDGSYLAAVNETDPVIYSGSLKKITTVPTNSIVGQFAWLNDSTLLYTMNDELWTYNLPERKAQLFSNMPLSESVTGLSISLGQDYVYVTTYNSFTTSYVLRRIGLKDQKVPKYIYRLQDVMPMRLSGHYLSLINFSGKPTVIVPIYPGESESTIVTSAKAGLIKRGFDISNLRFSAQHRGI